MTHALKGVLGETRNLIITVPPRSGKSLLASVALPAWRLGHNPSARVICASYAERLAIDFSNQCRAVMTSDWYRQAFPNTALNPRKNTETEFQTTRHGFRMATSVDGTLTGRGGDIVIIDDPMKSSDADSEATRDRVRAWFDQTVSSRLNDKTRGAFVLVMQRLHVDDLAGHLLEKGGWTHLNLPAIAEADAVIPLGRDNAGRLRIHHRRAGELLHPERETRQVLDRMKADLGPHGFAAQYQQDPVPAGGNMIDWAWFRRFGDYKDACIILGQLQDTEFQVVRDHVTSTCADSQPIRLGAMRMRFEAVGSLIEIEVPGEGRACQPSRAPAISASQTG